MIDSEALEILLTHPMAKRRKVFAFFHRVKAAPFTKGKWQTTDPTSRDIEVSIVEDLCIFHWTDHAIKTVNITRIEKSA